MSKKQAKKNGLEDNQLVALNLKDWWKVFCRMKGNSRRFQESRKQGDGDAEQSWCDVRCGIEIHIFHYKRNISAEMRRADLIIGHAGAGTTLESLELGKPLVVVINEALADNHQLELAERLAHDRHLLFTVPKKLADTLEDINLFKLESFPKADPLVFANFLNGQLSLKFD
uniref:UDP-N-acetylglucosamine transferase subunit ALG13 n=1 Tax=Ditylenchus dipsaci TaxID=166011 RepID=A0A915EC64_9BILA